MLTKESEYKRFIIINKIKLMFFMFLLKLVLKAGFEPAPRGETDPRVIPVDH